MVPMTEDMFGGPHHNDEVKRAEQCGWSTENENGRRDQLSQSAAQLCSCRGVSRWP